MYLQIMIKPSPISVSPTFYLTHNDIKKFGIPLLFKDFMVSKWNDCNELVNITSTKLTDTQSLEKWKSAFKSVATKCIDNSWWVATFAGEMAEYLDSGNGVNEFLASYHRKEMTRLNQQGNWIKERIAKKLKIEQYRALESQLDYEADNK